MATVNYNSHNMQAQKEDPSVEVFGIWAGRDIDAETLRKKAWRKVIQVNNANHGLK